jgi:hypothetical protein
MIIHLYFFVLGVGAVLGVETLVLTYWKIRSVQLGHQDQVAHLCR